MATAVPSGGNSLWALIRIRVPRAIAGSMLEPFTTESIVRRVRLRSSTRAVTECGVGTSGSTDVRRGHQVGTDRLPHERIAECPNQTVNVEVY